MSSPEVFEQVPALRAIPATERQALLPYAQLRVLRRKEPIWQEGQPTGEFTFVVRGQAKLVMGSEIGRETILNLAGPGDLMCANAVCSFAPYCCRAVAMEDETEVLVLPRRDLLQSLERSPEVARALLREITARGMVLCRRVEEVAAGQVERRIATLLVRLADQVGMHREEPSVWIPVALSRQDLADMCGTTIETAIRVMSRLKSNNIVRSVARGFIVSNMESLQAISRGDTTSCSNGGPTRR